MKNLLLSLALICYSIISEAQSNPFGYYEDALRYSRTSYDLGSSARIKAIGGAQVSLGGDISSAVSNPAGLGFFNKNVFVISPAIDFMTVHTDYTISSNERNIEVDSNESFKNNFNFVNLGMVINFDKGGFVEDKYKGGSLAISLNRIQSHHLARPYQGANDFNSLVDALAISADVTAPDDLNELAYAAYDQYLLSPVVDDDENITHYTANFDGYPIQSELIDESGSSYQFNMAWGGNYDDRLYFGGGIGVQIINFTQQRIYREFDFTVFDEDGNGTPDTRLNGFTLKDQLEIRGSGVNFNLGMIARPVDFVNIGISYTSPSFISLDEEVFLDLDADWKAGAVSSDMENLSEINSYQGALFTSNFKLKTPSRIKLGTSVFIGKSGFLTGDVEFLNHSNANIKSDDFEQSADNDAIENSYDRVVNIRLGGEYRIDNFMLRAGYSVFPSPYRNSNFDKQTNVTFGIGYRTTDYFLDLAIINSNRTVSYVPYEIENDQPIAFSDIQNTSFAVTFGLNF